MSEVKPGGSRSDGPFGGRIARITRMQGLVLIVVFGVCIAGGLLISRSFAQATPTTSTGTVVAVTRGTVSTSVSSSGSVVATKKANLSFSGSGKVIEVNVNVGDTVTTGKVLAKIDPTNLEIAVSTAESNLRSAQVKLQQTKTPATEDEIAAAQASYNAAVAKYQTTVAGPTASERQAAEQSVLAAEMQLEKAQNDLDTLRAEPTAATIRAAERKVEDAKNSLWQTQMSRDATKGNPTSKDYQIAQAEASVALAELAVARANEDLQTAKQPATQAELSASEKTVESARVSLEIARAKLAELNAKPAYADVQSAEASLASAKVSLANSTSGSTEDEIALAEISVKQAEIALKQAQANLAGATIVAPFDGVVSTMTLNLGDLSSGSATVITVLDPKAMRVDVSVAEIDIAKIVVGQRATITLDAISGKTFSGKVIAVAPSATVSQNVANYVVSLSVDPLGTTIPFGLTASGEIVYQEATNALLVPNKAITTQGRNKVVQVVTETGTETRQVTVGISGDSFTEIQSGLNDGDQVLMKTTTTTTGTSSSTNQNQRNSGNILSNMGGAPVMIPGGPGF